MHSTRAGWVGINQIIFPTGIPGSGANWIGKNRLILWPAAVKCAAKVTTVSQSYLEELRHNANGLENLFEYEKENVRVY